MLFEEENSQHEGLAQETHGLYEAISVLNLQRATLCVFKAELHLNNMTVCVKMSEITITKKKNQSYSETEDVMNETGLFKDNTALRCTVILFLLFRV